MNDKKSKSVSGTGILFAKNIGKAVFISLLLLLATTFVASAQCNHNLTVLGVCCDDDCLHKTWGWFYNETSGNWNYTDPAHPDCTVLFHLQDNTDGEDYYAYCTNYTVPLGLNDKFNASIYTAETSCKNNSRAHILNNWTYDCNNDCDNISAAQSAIWFFSYINESFCLGVGGTTPTYNHTAEPGDPGWESNWIPNCSAHPKACDFINASINKSVPYTITIDPSSGSFPTETPVLLNATVTYCLGAVGEQVTVRFEADNASCNFNGGSDYETKTVDGIANATLTCGAGVESVNVTAQVKDMKWFEMVDPTGCNLKEYQETLRIINLTDDVNFNFSDTPELGSWDGYVYEDPNCNCSYDDEQGVPNVNVSLHNDSGWEGTTKTNDTGYYLFINLTPGLYWANYNTSDLPSHLSPKCDNDTSEGGLIVDKYTSEEYEVPEGGRYRHNFAVESAADIDIEKLVDGFEMERVVHNQNITYTLTITNTGDVNLTNITVVDMLPADITWADAANPVQDSVTNNANGTTTIIWKNKIAVYPFKPGDSFEISFNATVNESAAYTVLHKNWATVNATSKWGDVSDKDHADVFIDPPRVPVLTPFGIAALIGLLSLVVVLSMSKSMRRKKG